jgi:hypothetical protein
MVVAGVCAGFHGLDAQSNVQRSDAATRTAQNVDRAQAAANVSLPTAEQADQDLGEQQVTSGDDAKFGFYALGETGLFYTSNATLTSGGGSGDMYFFARAEGGLRPHVGGGLYLHAWVAQDVFEYARFSALDFLKFSAGGGFDYVIPGTNGLMATVKYKYERFLDNDSFDEFFVNNSLEAGLAKEFSLSDVQAIQLGWRSLFSVLAEPSNVRRNEHAFWVGWRWRIVEPLELQIYNFLSLNNYPGLGARFDVSNYSGASLSLAVTRWARLAATGGFGVNSSTQSIYNYTAANVGATLTLNITF